MATYKYTMYESGYSHSSRYVKFNVSPDGGSICPGSTIKVTGEIYCAAGKLTTISAPLAAAWNSSSLDPLANTDSAPEASVSVPKATVKTFSYNRTVSMEMWERAHAEHVIAGSDVVYATIGLIFEGPNDMCVFDTYSGSKPVFTMPCVDSGIPDWVSKVITDMDPAQSMAALGGYAKGYNQLRCTVQFVLDTTTYPINSASHEIVVYDYNHPSDVLFQQTYNTAVGVNTLTVDIPTITKVCRANLTWRITDKYGSMGLVFNTDFNILEYSPPAITNLLLERYAVVPDAGGEAHEASDDGTHLWLTLAAGIAAVNSRNAWTAVMTYWDAALGESSAVTVTSQDGWTLGGTDGTAISLARDEAQLAGITADDTKDWRFRLTITDALNNSVTLVFDGIVKAGAVLDVVPGGVGVGMRCTGTEGGGELFQCAYPAQFGSNASFGGNVAVGASSLLKRVNMTVSISVASGDNHVSVSRTAAQVQAVIGTGWTPIGIVGSYTGSYLWYFYQLGISNGGIVASITRRDSNATSAATFDALVHILCIRTSL